MKEYEKWMTKAENDLYSAEKLSSGDDPVLDTAIYHTQQAAEKALKGFLAFHEKSLEHVHDVGHLVEKCMEIDSSFEQLLDSADQLTPFATAYRYPGIEMEPDYEDVLDSLKKAKSIINFIKTKLKF